MHATFTNTERYNFARARALFSVALKTARTDKASAIFILNRVEELLK